MFCTEHSVLHLIRINAFQFDLHVSVGGLVPVSLLTWCVYVVTGVWMQRSAAPYSQGIPAAVRSVAPHRSCSAIAWRAWSYRAALS